MEASLGWLSDPYRAMLAEDRHDHPEAFAYTTPQMFGGLSLQGAHALEIGSGTGLHAIYMALHGATVVSLEPEGPGATGGVIAKQRERCRRLNLHNVDVIAADFNTWQTSERFDVILSHNSINHLYPSSTSARSDQATRAGYIRVLRRIHTLLAPAGVFVATDAGRYAFFYLLRRMPRPWDPKRRTGINWRHHQTPSVWRELCREAGFSRTSIDYPVPYRLRKMEPLVNTAIANFWLTGSFILRAYR
jgi:SAM-dependent methyltransferase